MATRAKSADPKATVEEDRRPSEMIFRSSALELLTRADGSLEIDEAGRVHCIISTESPVERWGALETLGHDKSEVDMSFARNGISLLLEHGCYAFGN